MKKEDVFIGQRVIPFQKTVDGWGGLEYSIWSNAKEREQPYLYILFWDEDEGVFVLSDRKDDQSGDFFNPEDSEPYEKPLIALDFKDKILDALKIAKIDIKNEDGSFKCILDVLEELAKKYKN